MLQYIGRVVKPKLEPRNCLRYLQTIVQTVLANNVAVYWQSGNTKLVSRNCLRYMQTTLQAILVNNACKQCCSILAEQQYQKLSQETVPDTCKQHCKQYFFFHRYIAHAFKQHKNTIIRYKHIGSTCEKHKKKIPS